MGTRFGQSARIEDLEEAISLNREAVTLCPLGHPDRSTSLNNLASDLGTLFDQSGRMEDLEETISLDREALTRRPLGHPYRSIPQ